MGLFIKDSSEEICKYCIKGRERRFQKGAQETLSQIPEGFTTIAVQDESIFVHDVIIRRKLWLPKGIRPVVTVTGSHQRTCVFGTLTMEGKQLFRQYDKFNQDTFLDYLKQVNKRLGKVVMFTDCFTNGAFLQRFHRRDLLIQHQKKRKRLSKRGTRITLTANHQRIHNSSTG